MSTLDDDTIERITQRNGKVSALLRQRRELLDRLAALNTGQGLMIPVTIHPAGGAQFQMRMPTHDVHRLLEIGLAAIERALQAEASVPLDFYPDEQIQAALPATPATEGDSDHG